MTSPLVEILSAQAAETEKQGRPTAKSLQAAREAGAFALPDRTATEAAQLLTEMARGCPSTSWIAGTSLTGKTFSRRALGDVIGPDTLVAGSGTPGGRGERAFGGVRVTGRWANVSGCEDAEWAGLAVLIDGTLSWALFPLRDLRVEHTWSAVGMRGTGSHTLVAEDVLVPVEREAPLDFAELAGDMVLFGLTALAPVVGATLGALDLITAMFASDRKPYMSAYASMGESPAARTWRAEAIALARRAERTMLALAAAGPGDHGLDMSGAARDCRAAMDLMLDLHGASGFAESNPLQRHWRDVAVASRHPHINAFLAVNRL
ncbi:acyl-CoA dehydrogenase [Actinoplanes sp. TRM 88003]|uniref:Acyl-CoA dehydrogenase n=1 Tax=Paractinoplanes aksuensis TaxID=2939490 RepID=A0ABT1DZ75_9ACTN|nr:acyl-CoA dehydrogenase [Actinoplanes aksuensis]MCO8276162.1 acyl-CoA dehydrogenase [Actinoplanes aksuensis]